MIFPTVTTLFSERTNAGPCASPVFDNTGPHFLGPFTPNSMWLRASKGLPNVDRATARLAWSVTDTPVNGPMANGRMYPAFVYLMKFDDGGTVLEIAGGGSNSIEGYNHIVNDGLDITAVVNAIVDAGVDKRLGLAFCGDGVNPINIWDMRFEFDWILPDVTAGFKNRPGL